MEIERKYYLTTEGLKNLKKEYKKLIDIRISKAKSDGAPEVLHSEDLNPEYLSFQENLDFLERRIIELEDIFKNTELIKPPLKKKRNIIAIGAEVLVDVNGRKDEFKIVGTLEANPSFGKISNESPVGRALLGCQIGDKVTITSSKKMVYKIKEIRYTS
ncbi:MAG: GreA/GreB family elongation factor [Patescibacteria group bacterium]|nr:GreA/GreB family elongation factor [Patescibacteria group bacterium]